MKWNDLLFFNIYVEKGEVADRPFRPRAKPVPKGHSQEMFDDPYFYQEHKEDIEQHRRRIKERHKKFLEKMNKQNRASKRSKLLKNNFSSTNQYYKSSYNYKRTSSGNGR